MYKISLLLVALSINLTTAIAQSSKYDSKFAYIDEAGNVKFKIACKYAGNFSKGMASISKYTIEGTKAYFNYGFINTEGEIVIPCIYEKVYDFNSSVTFVKKRGELTYELIDKTGKLVTDKKFSTVGYFFEGMCAFYENDQMGFIDSAGKVVIEPKYTGSPSFTEGLVCVCPYNSKVGAYGFIDKKGTVVIPMTYNQAGYSGFYNGEARMQIAGKTVLINKKNEVVFKPKQNTFSGFSSNGLGAVCTKADRTGWGYINRKGDFVIQPIYTHVDEEMKDNLAIVEIKGKYGVIDSSGKVIIPIKYVNLYGDKESGFFAVQNSDNQQDRTFLDMNGKEFVKTKVKYLYGAEGSKLIPYADAVSGLEGYLNRIGEVVIKPIYKRAKIFSEGLASVEFLAE